MILTDECMMSDDVWSLTDEWINFLLVYETDLY